MQRSKPSRLVLIPSTIALAVAFAAAFTACAGAPPPAATATPAPEAEQPAQAANAPEEPQWVDVRVPVRTKATTFFGDGAVDEYTVTQWNDALSDMRSQTRFTASGAVIERTDFESRDGKVLAKSTYDAEGKKVSTRTYGYGADGRLSEERLEDGAGKSISSFEYSYDSAGDRTKWVVKDGAGSILAITEYGYKDGRLVSALLEDGAGRRTGSSEYAYDPEGRLVEQTIRDAKGSILRVETTAWENGRIVREERKSAGGQLLMKTDYAYGPDGELAAKNVEDFAAKSSIKTLYEYAFRMERRPVMAK